MSNPALLLTCAEFRAKRDAFQAQRRKECLPLLKTRQTALWQEIKALTRQRDGMSKHDKQAVDGTLRALWAEWSYVYGQVEMIGEAA